MGLDTLDYSFSDLRGYTTFKINKLEDEIINLGLEFEEITNHQKWLRNLFMDTKTNLTINNNILKP